MGGDKALVVEPLVDELFVASLRHSKVNNFFINSEYKKAFDKQIFFIKNLFQ